MIGDSNLKLKNWISCVQDGSGILQIADDVSILAHLMYGNV